MELFSKVLKKIVRQQNFLMVLLAVGFTAIIVLSQYQSYQKQIEIHREEQINYLSAVVKSGVGFIDGDAYEELLNYEKEDFATETEHDFFKLKKTLGNIQRLNGLETEVYILSKLDPEKDVLHLIVNSGDSNWYKHVYQAPTELLQRYETGGKLGPYEDENGVWLSSFAPIYNSKNQVVGSLQADVHFDEFEKAVLHDVYNEVIRTAILYGIVVVILLLITRSKVSHIRRLQNTFLNLSDSLREKNSQLVEAQEEVKKRNEELSQLNLKLEDRIKERTQQLEAKNDELNTFFYHASHQMKTPVVNILGLVELAKLEEQELDVINHLNKIGKLSKRTIRLLDQLNKASYANTGENKPLVLEDFIASCAKDHPYKDCVTTSIYCNGATFHSNPYLLQVIFDAVLENSIYFAKKTADEDALVEINCSVDEEGLVTKIRDNGPGMSPEIISKACNMFFVGNPLSKGNGLGLYVAEQAIAKLNGKLHIESVVGSYTETTIKVPLSFVPVQVPVAV